MLSVPGYSQTTYDLLLHGGHVVDAKSHLSAVRDVAIRNGRIAAVEEHIDPSTALKTVDVHGLYVTPGLIDIHVHAYASTGERNSYAGDESVWPDGFTFRAGVTTVADAGSSGYKNFEDFKEHVIDRSKTRVLAFLNIVGAGMRGPKFENNLSDMEPQPAAEMAQRHPGLIIGIKTAHYAGPEWTPVEHAVEAGTIAHIPVMVDFGENHPERPISVLLGEKLRPGDIYTHCYSGLRDELLPDGKINPGMFEGRRRGVIFDVGHGGRKFFLACCYGRDSAGVSSRFHFDGFAHRKHELGHEEHAKRDEQNDGFGVVAGRRDCTLDVESSSRDSSR